MNVFKKCVYALFMAVNAIIILLMLPYMIKTWFPVFWGTLEGTFERDLTAFCFVIGSGAGECRIKNSKIAFADREAKIYLGHLTNPVILKRNPTNYHLWGKYSNGNLIDVVCPPDLNPVCKDRTFFAIIDADTLTLEYNRPDNETDKDQVEWAVRYLPSLKTSLRKYPR